MNGTDLTPEEMQKRLSWYGKKYGPYIEKRGLHNWKNLFRKPNMYEWTILFLLILALSMSWLYAVETQKARETLDNLDAICATRESKQVVSPEQNITPINFTLNIQTNEQAKE